MSRLTWMVAALLLLSLGLAWQRVAILGRLS
jgi:hypothetical protein